MESHIILHNQVSLNGAFLGFEVNMDKYYSILSRLQPGFILMGSNTARSGIETYYENIPVESSDDFRKPAIQDTDKRPYWVVPDSTGKLMGYLHVYRNAGYCKDVIVFISRNTPESYKQYLHERNYEYFSYGYNKVDLGQCLNKLENLYGPGKIVTDCGRSLAKKLFDLHMIKEISLIISPLLTGKEFIPLMYNLTITDNINLNLESVRDLDNGLIHLKYTVAEKKSK